MSRVVVGASVIVWLGAVVALAAQQSSDLGHLRVEPVASLPVSARTAGGQIPLGTTDAEGLLEIEWDAAELEAGAKVDVHLVRCDGEVREIVVVASGEECPAGEDACECGDPIGSFVWGQDAPIVVGLADGGSVRSEATGRSWWLENLPWYGPLAGAAVLSPLIGSGDGEGGGSRNTVPTVRFLCAPDRGAAGWTTVQCLSVATDEDGDRLTQTWSFGDGGMATGDSTAHVYDQPGSYTVRLTVTDGVNQTSAVQTLTVDRNPGGEYPAVPFGLSAFGIPDLRRVGPEGALLGTATFGNTELDLGGQIGTGTNGICTPNDPCRATFTASGRFDLRFDGAAARGADGTWTFFGDLTDVAESFTQAISLRQSP